MATVVFDADEFLAAYPQFTDVFTAAQLEQAFNVACLILDNTSSSPVPYDPDDGDYTRKTLLYLLTCHLATLKSWTASGQSGPLTSATEGSVSAGFSLPSTGTGDAWYNQTPCGSAFAQAMAAYRVGPKYYGVNKYHPWG